MLHPGNSPEFPPGPAPHDGLPAVSPDLVEEQDGDRMGDLVPTPGYAQISMVGLGGSAGSIAALQEFFRAMPADSGLVFVVILHLAPERASSLAELLGHVTPMPVQQARDGQRVQANHVYVIPPGKFLSATDDRLRLTDLEPEKGSRVAVDLFFRSLADSHGAHCMAVVLSGADGDGAVGLKRVKERGGLTIAQDPEEAEHPGMPRSAVATGMVDWVLPVGEMPARILEYHRRADRLSVPTEEGPQPALPPLPPPGDEAEAALRDTLAYLRGRTGRDFSYYKRATIVRRIARRMQVNGVDDMPAYLGFLRTHPGEAGALLQDLLITVTNFFRDREAFAELEARVPALFAHKGPGDTVRVWVAACATGEEAYSIAMLLLEHAATLPAPPAIQVFGSDLDEAAIQVARAGVYHHALSADVSETRIRHFFTRDPQGYRVRREVRETVLFAAHDVLKDAPFSRMDLVSCRNLLIYLNREAQGRALEIFHFALRPGGTLFLGTSDSVEDGGGLFTTLDKKHRLFARAPGASLPLPVPAGPSTLLRAVRAQEKAREGPALPGLLFDGTLPEALEPLMRGGVVPPARAGDPGASLGELHFRLIERFAPPSVIVNADQEVVHLSENAGRYLQFTGGEPTTNLLRVVHPMLRIELRAALFRVTETNAPVEVFRVPVEIDGESGFVNLRVSPARELAPGFLLVVFEPRPRDPAEEGVAATTPRVEAEPIVRHLEREMEQVKSQLRDTVEQYEAGTEELKASNEELQAMNEELRSATEELETSREELQSINEELTTVNQELKGKVDELGHANSDLHNLMASTAIATVFLDRDLCVMRFTPVAVELFHFIPGDLGRPLSDLRNRLYYPELVGDARRVLADLVPIEREVGTTDGRWYLTRLLPYRTTDDRIAGVVLTFINVTARRRQDEALRVNEERMRRTFEIETVGIFYFRPDGTVTGANPAFLRLSGYSREDMESGRVNCDMLTAPEFLAETRRAREELLRLGRSTPYEKQCLRKDGTRWWGLLSAARLGEDECVKFVIDVADRKRAESALLVSEERFRQFAENSADVLWIVDAGSRRLEYVSPAFERVWGETPATVLGKVDHWAELVHPEDRESMGQIMPRLLAGETVTAEYRILHPRNGEVRWVRDTGFPIHDAAGAVHRVAGIAQDTTEERRAGETLRRSEETLRLVLENARDYAILSTDLERRVLSWNAGAQAILGYTEAEARGKRADVIFTPEDLAAGAPRQEADTALAEGRAADERQHVRKDGSRFWASGVMMAMRDARGEAIGLVKIFRDQTEARAAQEALERSRARLVAALAENERARAEAEAAGRAKDHFLAVLSHELRTPLTPVLMATRTLARRRDLPPAVTEALAMISRNVQLEAHFIDDLLDLTRIARGKLEIVRAPMDLHDAVRRAVEVTESDLEDKGHRLEVALGAPEHRLDGDFSRLQQVVWNLLKNASKFTPASGEIRLVSRAGEPGQVVVEITDTGIGIEAEVVNRIFNPFEQADVAITRQFGGLGLGLAISKATVEAHGGTLQASSPGPNQGATFTVTLPLATSQEQTVGPGSALSESGKA